MANCSGGNPPHLVNGQFAILTGRCEADYSCLSGFKMSGSGRLSGQCNNGMCSWTGSSLGASCDPIDNQPKVNNHVYVNGVPVWEGAIIASLLGLLTLACLAYVIAHLCCGYGGGQVGPAGTAASSCCACCRRQRKRRQRRISSDSEAMYYDREERVVHIGNGPYVVPLKNTGNYEQRPHNKNLKHVIVSERNNPNTKLAHEYYGSAESVGSPRSDDGYVGDRAGRKTQQPKWMPHTHPVRSINTSTK